MIGLIVARSRNNVIGNALGIPWKIKGEQLQFKVLTEHNIVIMGRKTFEDMGRPHGLPDRLNIVVSNTRTFKSDNVVTARSFQEAIDIAKSRCGKGGYPGGDIYIAGGYSLYSEAIPMVDRMYITEIDMDVPEGETTVYFPEFNKDDFERMDGNPQGEDVKYTRTIYIRPGGFALETLSQLAL